jgi:predicted secreted protein
MNSRSAVACLAICIAMSVASSLSAAGPTAGRSSWTKTFGGKANDRPYSIEQTADGGFVVAAETESYGGGKRDFWVLQLDPAGELRWQNTYGGRDNDWALKAVQLSDKGYLVGGVTESLDNRSHIWILNLDGTGAVRWQNAYGEKESETGEGPEFLQVAPDGASVVGAWGGTTGEPERSTRTSMRVFGLDASGNPLWQSFFNPSLHNVLSAVQSTSDGGCVVAGQAATGTRGNEKLVILRLNPKGNLLWKVSYGGAKTDQASSIQQTEDGGFIVAGTTTSFGAGGSDIWLLKLDAKGNVVWQEALGGKEADTGASVRQTADRGYVVAGTTESFDSQKQDVLLIKVSATGELLWQRAFGGKGNDGASAIVPTADHGFALAAETQSFGEGKADIWILKLDPNGNAASPCEFCRNIAVTITPTNAAR